MSPTLKHGSLATIAIAMTACGGGGSVPATPPSLPVQLAISEAVPQLIESGAGPELTVTASYSGSSSSSSSSSDHAIVPVFGFDDKLFVQQGALDTASPGKAVLHLRARDGLAAGNYAGKVAFRLCQESACATVYPGSSQTVAYTVKVALADWTTFQRDNHHTGYLHVTLDPAKFTKLWDWARPAGDPEPVGGINTVATGMGMVFVSKDIYSGLADLYALKEADGSQVWHYSSGRMASEGPPAYADGTVYFATTTSDERSRLTALDAATGHYRFVMPYDSQWTAYLAPTVAAGSVLHTSGAVSSWSAADGKLAWRVPAGAYDVATPATDGSYVYQYGSAGGGNLSVFERTSGALVAKINDPFFPGASGNSEFAAPMVGSAHNVIAFSGGGFSGMAASSSEQYEQRVLVNYDIARQAVGWRTADAYQTHPALGNGVLYAATATRLDAIGENDGRVLWSWALPAGDTGFHHNVVLTDNLVFVSTDRAVYALDLKTHAPVWQYAQGGSLAISGGGILYITTGVHASDGRLVAVKLM